MPRYLGTLVSVLGSGLTAGVWLTEGWNWELKSERTARTALYMFIVQSSCLVKGRTLICHMYTTLWCYIILVALLRALTSSLRTSGPAWLRHSRPSDTQAAWPTQLWLGVSLWIVHKLGLFGYKEEQQEEREESLSPGVRIVWYGMVWLVMWDCLVWYSIVWCGVVWYSMV